MAYALIRTGFRKVQKYRMSEKHSDEEPIVEGPLMSDAHVVRWYMWRINDAYEGGSGDNVNQLIVEMEANCDKKVIRRVALENQLARQSLRTDQVQ